MALLVHCTFVGSQDTTTKQTDGDTFYVLSLMPARNLDAFVARLRRWNEGLLNKYFCYWALKYLEGNLDSPPPLVDTSASESEDDDILSRHVWLGGPDEWGLAEVGFHSWG